MSEQANYRELPVRKNHNCFGCSPNNSAGLKMRFRTDGEALYSQLSVPEHLCGWGTIVHGGVQSTILDEIMGWTALYMLKKVSLTKSMKVDFLKPVYIGDPLNAESRVKEIHQPREAVMEAFLYNGGGELCTKAEGIFGLFSLKAMRRLKIMDEEALRTVEEIVKG